MSNRNFEGFRLAATDRREDRRKDRHKAKTLLYNDPEDTFSGQVARRHLPPETHIIPESVPGRKVRHWKQPFWKRRTALRHQKNVLMDQLQKEGTLLS